MSIGVFISYNHVDRRIANELRSCLVKLSDSIEAFVDHAALKAGDDYEEKISRYINASTWFIMVNPGEASNEKDMDWCIYEAGQFRNKLASHARSEKDITERMCVIYDVTIPPPLQRYHAIRIQDCTLNDERLDLSADNPLIEHTSVYRLFTSILQRPSEDGGPIRDTSDPTVREIIRDLARRFIVAFRNEQVDRKLDEIPLQPRISLMLSGKAADGSNGVGPAIEVSGWEGALSDIFGIAGEKTTWGEIKSAFRLPSGADALWVQDVEEALLDITAGKVPTQTNMLIHASNGSLFRPVVARYIRFVSGRRQVFISFIQAPRRSLVPNEARAAAGLIIPKQQVLLISLLFAFRFKQRVLPLADSAKGMAGDRERLKALLMRIEREIMIIENEAEEYGFDVSEEQVESPQLTDSISIEDDQNEIRRIVADWAVVRRNLVALLSDLRNPKTDTGATDVSAEVVGGLASMKGPNKLFTEIVVRELARSQELDLCSVMPTARRPVELAGSRMN